MLARKSVRHPTALAILNFNKDITLSKLFERVIGEFDYYGTTIVTKAQWNDLVKISQDTHFSWQEIITEAFPWVDRCFKDHEVFTILGI